MGEKKRARTTAWQSNEFDKNTIEHCSNLIKEVQTKKDSENTKTKEMND